MAYRTFVDKRSTYWQVWDVHPQRIERRSVDRRKQPAGAWTKPERRKNDRRKIEQKRIVLQDGLGSGWLVFESKSEKRRLAPIPADWATATESHLRYLCESAQIVSGANGNTSAA